MAIKGKDLEARIAFGNSLYEKRRKNGLSQEELAEQIGKSAKAISRYENGQTDMDVHTFTKMINALKVSPYELLPEMNRPETDEGVASILFELARLPEEKRKAVVSIFKTTITNIAAI